MPTTSFSNYGYRGNPNSYNNRNSYYYQNPNQNRRSYNRKPIDNNPESKRAKSDDQWRAVTNSSNKKLKKHANDLSLNRRRIGAVSTTFGANLW